MKYDDITKFKTGSPRNAHKHHLFYGGSTTSVCRKWLWLGATYELHADDPMPFGTDRDDCKTCSRPFLKLREVK